MQRQTIAGFGRASRSATAVPARSSLNSEAHTACRSSPLTSNRSNSFLVTRGNPDGGVLVQKNIVPGIAYGAPLQTSDTDAYGSSAPFMLDVGISSTLHIAACWDVTEAPGEAQP